MERESSILYFRYGLLPLEIPGVGHRPELWIDIFSRVDKRDSATALA